jgi:hypothetical protein
MQLGLVCAILAQRSEGRLRGISQPVDPTSWWQVSDTGNRPQIVRSRADGGFH